MLTACKYKSVLLVVDVGTHLFAEMSRLFSGIYSAKQNRDLHKKVDYYKDISSILAIFSASLDTENTCLMKFRSPKL